MFSLLSYIGIENKLFAQDWDNLDQQATEYYNQGDYTNAIIYDEKALLQAKVEFGDSTQNYAVSLNNLAYLYEETGNYSKAENLYLKALDINKKVFGEEHPEYALTLNNLAALYQAIGNYTKAEPFYLQALEIRKEFLGENHPYYTSTLCNLATLYQATGNFSKAEPLYLQSLAIRKKNLGEKHPEYAISLNNLALFYSNVGNFSKAEPLYLQALEIYEKNFGQEHPGNSSILNNLALLYMEIANFSKAEPLLLKALQIDKKIFGQEHPNYATSLNNLAGLYMDLGNFSKAEPLYLQSLAIRKKKLGEEHPDYGTSLNNLAGLYKAEGDFSKAEPLYLQSLAIRKINLGEEHPEYALSLNNLALFYSNIGHFSKAEPLYLKALEICKKVLGEEHTEYATIANNLASLYEKTQNFSKAEPFYLKALEINKKVLGEESPNYGTSLNNLGLFYYHTGNYSEAESLLLKALEFDKKTLGEENAGYSTSLNNLASIYQAIGNFPKAESFYLESIEIQKKLLRTEHADYAVLLTNLGVLYFETNNYVKAEQMFLLAKDIYIVNIEKNIDFLSQEEMEKYLTTVSNNFEIYKSFSLKYYRQKHIISIEALTIDLFAKSILLTSTMQLRQSILSRGDTATVRIFNDWMNERKALANQYSKPPAEQKGIEELEKHAEEIEKQLTRISADFRKQKKESKITWKQIQEQTPSNSATIEFTSFNFYNKGWTDSTVYVALLLKKNVEYPEIIYQFEEKELHNLLSPYKGEETVELNQLYSVSDDSSSDLYHLIWQPLEPYLKRVDTIHFSPSGMLHLIDLQAITTPDGKRLGEKYNLVQMSTTRNVVNTSGEPDKSSITLFGGIDYDFKPSTKDSITKETDFQKPDLSTANRGGNEYWYPLEETKKEIEQIQQQFAANKNQTTLITGAQATEEAFKSLSGKSPKILHISTHGFFFPDVEKKKEDKRMMSIEEDKSVFKISEYPLLRSGLIMARGNYAWQNGSNPYEKEDGILTAYEIANMDLSNTDLVVLSACETGLGEIKGSEGVFGLQRAFKMAGVDYLMMSLWKVPDKETKEFMQLFYSNWLGGMKIRDAFRYTQLTMNKTYPNEPYKWAAFVLVE